MNEPVDRKQILAAVAKVRPLPQVVLKVASLAADLDAPLDSLKEEIHQDSVLTGQLLRLCNSAHYGHQREIASLHDAIVRLGFGTIRKLAITLAFQEYLDRPLEGYAMARGDFRRHAMGCAVVGEHLLKRWPVADAETVYTAGLLHDLGKIVLDSYVGDQAAPIHDLLESGMTFPEAEREVLGIDHGEVGLLLAEAWGLPPILAEVMAFHHEPRRAEEAPDLVALVHLVDCLCMMMGLGLGLDGLAYRIDDNVLTRFGLKGHSLHHLLEELPEVLDPALALFAAVGA